LPIVLAAIGPLPYAFVARHKKYTKFGKLQIIDVYPTDLILAKIETKGK